MIKIYPSAVLREKCDSWNMQQVDGLLDGFLKYMKAIMYTFDGVGLAAPQIGEKKRIFVADITSDKEERNLGTNFMVFVNPVVLEKSEDEIDSEEGCLSFPGVSERVKRASEIKVRCDYPIWHGETEIEADGLLSRVIQHELDHLDGITLIDKVGSARQHFIRKNVKKRAKDVVTRQKILMSVVNKMLEGENNG